MKHIKTYNYPRRVWRFMNAALLLVACAIAPFGCTISEEPLPECPGKGETVPLRVSFSMSAAYDKSPLFTRTDPDNHPEVEADNLWEDAIDISSGDYAIYAFNADGECTFSSRALPAGSDDLKVFGSPSSGYVVNSYIGDVDLTGVPDEVTFTVVVMANLESAGGKYPTPVVKSKAEDGAATAGTSIAKFESNKVLFTLHSSNTGGWYPGEEFTEGGKTRTAFIPMYGKKQYKIKKTVLSDPANPQYQLTDIAPIYLLRALAKVEIIDAIDKENGNDEPGIESVKIYGFRKDGWLTPDNFIEYNQVADLTIPEGELGENSVPNVSAWPMKAFRGDKVIANVDGKDIVRTVNFWRIYIPEQALANIPNRQIAPSPPIASITIKGITDGGREINFNKYTSATSFSSKIMRNHIYRVAVMNLKAETTLVYTVCPWDDEYEINPPAFE